ncbi:MAG TPA: long-chain fatty acid--CoA ligase [Terriglobales bacterium]|nr:long-chain fatty acid--CoA ligase [Terriglobales bacterium]
MKGTMMRFPLTLPSLFERAGKLFPQVEIISQRPDNSTHRYTYADWFRRTNALAATLQHCGIKRGDRVATLMWNHSVHLEAYFGIPIVGGVLHTLNLRLHPDELAFIINHAEDRFLIVDDVLLPLLEKVRGQVNIEKVFVTSFGGCQRGSGAYEDYETAISNCHSTPVRIELDEDDALGMCYTSGTTGKPKGVVYSHRAIALHSYSISLPDNFCISRNDTILPAMSMFHANAWGMPFAAIMNGSGLVLPGPNLQPDRLLDLLSDNQVTLTGAVPTVWLGVIDALEREPDRWTLPEGMRVIVAGSACPEALFRRFDKFDVHVIQPWGMTETTPIATVCTPKPHMKSWPDNRKYEIRAKQGLPSPFTEVRATSDDGEIPWDGKSVGELEVRGPFIAAGYFKLPEESSRWTSDGWLRTGDVVTIDPEGYVKITDRSKDLIKSGGEWISSVDVENALVAHPCVAEAAVIAVPHPKWQERPLAVVVVRKGSTTTEEDLRSFLCQTFAKWQLPDAIVFVDQLPHTSTGKLLKSELRRTYANWSWQPVDASS